MNTIFSFKRFGRYWSTEFRATRRRFLKMIGLTAAIDLALVIFFSLNQSIADANQDVYTVALVGVAIVSAVLISNAFRSYHNAMSAPRMIMLPVSQCEKFAFIFLYNVILIPVVLFGLIYLMQTTIGILVGDFPVAMPQSNISTDLITRGDLFYELIVDSILYYSIYLFGAILFRRAQFVLTSVSLITILMIFGWALVYYIGIRSVLTPEEIEAISLNANKIGMIVTYCLIPVVILFTWLRFRSFQLRK